MVSRSRRYIVLGVIGFAVAVALRNTLARIPLMVIIVAVAAYNIVLAWRQMQAVHRRPAAFTVSGRGFSARLQHSQGFVAMMFLMLAGNLSSGSLDDLGQQDRISDIFTWVGLVFSGILTALAVLLALLAWGMDDAGIVLTPDGVVTQVLWDRRFIPWEALAPGGPLHPGPLAGHLRLVFARPDLVRYRRYRLPGSAKDMIMTGTHVHPSFLADAIRWYVEHPEDRAAIGTEAEHARLVEAVGAAAYGPVLLPVPVPPQQPPQVHRAIRLAQVGVVFGPLAAIVDVALLSRFDPFGWKVHGMLVEGWHLAASVLIIALAVVAMLAIESLKRGNESGRVGLIVVSALAVAWALVPFDLAFVASDGATSLLTVVMVVKRLGELGLGAATLMPLLSPAARSFTHRTEMRPA